MVSWDNLGGLLGLLAIGGLFYWMMRRGGCGMGAGPSRCGGHGHHGGAGGGMPPRGHGGEEVRDPVCGMPVDPGSAAGTRSFEGRTFPLCSKACLEKFDRDPASYARRASEEKSSAGRSGHGRHGC